MGKILKTSRLCYNEFMTVAIAIIMSQSYSLSLIIIESAWRKEMRNASQENYLLTAFFLKSGHGILIDKIDHSFYSKENWIYRTFLLS